MDTGLLRLSTHPSTGDGRHVASAQLSLSLWFVCFNLNQDPHWPRHLCKDSISKGSHTWPQRSGGHCVAGEAVDLKPWEERLGAVPHSAVFLRAGWRSDPVPLGW